MVLRYLHQHYRWSGVVVPRYRSLGVDISDTDHCVKLGTKIYGLRSMVPSCHLLVRISLLWPFLTPTHVWPHTIVHALSLHPCSLPSPPSTPCPLAASHPRASFAWCSLEWPSLSTNASTFDLAACPPARELASALHPRICLASYGHLMYPQLPPMRPSRCIAMKVSFFISRPRYLV